MNNLRVLLVDDEPLLLESLEIILSLNGMQITGMAHDGREALAVLKNTSCDLALVDLNMKGMGGIELISHMKSEYPDIKILVLTTFYDDKNITQAITNGADGYLLKDSGKAAILGAIDQVMGGRNVIDGKVMQRLAALMSHTAGENREASDIKKPEESTGETFAGNSANSSRGFSLPDDITSREEEICTLLAQGLTNRQIAETLYISEGTVKNYISSIYDKTGIHDRAKLIVAIKG